MKANLFKILFAVVCILLLIQCLRDTGTSPGTDTPAQTEAVMTTPDAAQPTETTGEVQQQEDSAPSNEPQQLESPVQSEEPQPEPTPEPTASETMVWIPNSGSKYHRIPGCSNMQNPSQVTKSQAESMGYTACKRCW